MIPQNQIDFVVNHIIDQMTVFLMEDYGLSLASALKYIYESEVYHKLLQTDLELFVQSSSYIYELLKNEIKLQKAS